jgi:NAD(P)-dependent dehydrogenase (short-subunit alcohol dehydrogenase family)
MYLERLKLTGRRAVVTGGAAGIGLACAEALAEMGAHVTLADRDAVAIAAGRAALADKGHAVDGHVVDVTNSAQVTALADQLGAIDILVNNAGIARSETAAEDVADEH